MKYVYFIFSVFLPESHKRFPHAKLAVAVNVSLTHLRSDKGKLSANSRNIVNLYAKDAEGDVVILHAISNVKITAEVRHLFAFN